MVDDPMDGLVRAWQAGDTSAFDELVALTGSSLLGFLISQLGDRAMAEDAWSETYLRVIRARDRYEPKQRFSVYLFTIARRCAQDQQRGHRRFLRLLRRVTDAGGTAQADARRPDLELQASERSQRIDALLQRLSERHRTAVVLTYRLDLASAEVGEIMGLTAGQVRSLLSYSRKRLREWMEG